MTFIQGISLILVGTITFVVGMLVLRPESGAPRDWRFWIGTVIGIIGVGVALYAAFALLQAR